MDAIETSDGLSIAFQNDIVFCPVARSALRAAIKSVASLPFSPGTVADIVRAVRREELEWGESGVKALLRQLASSCSDPVDTVARMYAEMYVVPGTDGRRGPPVFLTPAGRIAPRGVDQSRVYELCVQRVLAEIGLVRLARPQSPDFEFSVLLEEPEELFRLDYNCRLSTVEVLVNKASRRDVISLRGKNLDQMTHVKGLVVYGDCTSTDADEEDTWLVQLLAYFPNLEVFAALDVLAGEDSFRVVANASGLLPRLHTLVVDVSPKIYKEFHDNVVIPGDAYRSLVDGLWENSRASPVMLMFRHDLDYTADEWARFLGERNYEFIDYDPIPGKITIVRK